MVPSPAKRRKVSPTSALPIPVSMPSTPSRIPVPRDGAKTTPGRPSFASPTKASIAKHNPQLLDRPRSAGTAADREAGKENLPQPVERQLFVPPEIGETGAVPEEATRIPDLTRQEGVNEAQETAGPFTDNTVRGAIRSTNGGISAAPRRRSRSRTPGKENIRPQLLSGVEPPQHGADSSERVLPPDPFRTAGLRRSPLHPRPDPEPSVPAAEQSIPPDPFRTAGLRRSPVVPQAAETQPAPVTTEHEDSDLPLTPTQRGLADPVVTTPPSGIHNTPSKRPKKRPRGTKPKSSPLKPRAEPETQIEPYVPIKRRKVEYEPRHLVPPDPYAEKKKIRDQLLEEARQLQADIALAERENERQRIQHKSRKHSNMEAPNPDEILGLLKRATLPANPITPTTRTTLSQSICSFLPFAKRRRPPPAPPINDTLPVTHLPVTLDDPINHLKLFTPLSFDSAIFVLPPTPPTITTASSTEILQSHTITARAPSGLLTARVGMIVNTATFTISSLQIEKLDAFADPELGTWMRDRATGKGVLGRDVNAICWAMGRWYELAVKRARFWLMLEAELGTEEGRRRNNERINNAVKRKKTTAEAIDYDFDGGGVASGSSKRTRRQLLPYMGRQDFVLASAHVELRVEWVITFDWTGEAESVISASARVPLSCEFFSFTLLSASSSCDVIMDTILIQIQKQGNSPTPARAW